MKLVRIQSTRTIAVTPGLQHLDVTNPDAHIPDRLKVSAEWPKCRVVIKKGVGEYPEDIKNWATVKALIKDNVITVGEVVEPTTDEQVQEIEKFEQEKRAIKTREKKTKNLAELSE